MDPDDDPNYEDRNKKADGYECQRCGYTPTWLELNRGSCPQCPSRSEHRKKINNGASARGWNANNE